MLPVKHRGLRAFNPGATAIVLKESLDIPTYHWPTETPEHNRCTVLCTYQYLVEAYQISHSSVYPSLRLNSWLVDVCQVLPHPVLVSIGRSSLFLGTCSLYIVTLWHTTAIIVLGPDSSSAIQLTSIRNHRLSILCIRAHWLSTDLVAQLIQCRPGTRKVPGTHPARTNFFLCACNQLHLCFWTSPAI